MKMFLPSALARCVLAGASEIQKYQSTLLTIPASATPLERGYCVYFLDSSEARRQNFKRLLLAVSDGCSCRTARSIKSI